MKIIRWLPLLILLVVLNSCSEPVIEKCPIKELLIDKNSLPSGAIEEDILSPMPDAPSISAGRSININNYSLYHKVYQYPPGYYAKLGYLEDVKEMFPVDHNFGPWLKPKINFESKYADESFYACGYAGKQPQCQMIARYGDYVTFARLQIGADMTETDFEHVMLIIDQKMSNCIESGR